MLLHSIKKMRMQYYIHIELYIGNIKKKNAHITASYKISKH